MGLNQRRTVFLVVAVVLVLASQCNGDFTDTDQLATILRQKRSPQRGGGFGGGRGGFGGFGGGRGGFGGGRGGFGGFGGGRGGFGGFGGRGGLGGFGGRGFGIGGGFVPIIISPSRYRYNPYSYYY